MSIWQGVPDLRKRNGRRNTPTPTTPRPVLGKTPTVGPLFFNTPTMWSPNKLFHKKPFSIEKPLFDETSNFRRVPWASSRIFNNLPPLPTTVRPFDRPYTLKSFEEWKDFKLPELKSELPAVTPSPSLEALHMTTKVMYAISSLVGSCLMILVAYGVFVNRKDRPKGVVVPAPVFAGAVEQGIVIDRRPSGPGEPGALNNDLPPPYYEFQPSTDKCIAEMPPPYNPEDVEQDHKQPIDHTNVIGFDAYIEHVDPEMRTELVFDNGRIVQRLSLDGNSYNNETG